MADLETTQSKLRSTPTAGVSGEHSAYYRRLLSAGYKGYVQGSIGGGTLYGAIGLAIGSLVALPLLPVAGLAGLALIPAVGAGMGLYGAHAFADIGKTAAIIADSADTNEKRRYLLDRYYETPSEEEAKEIKRQLEQVHEARAPESAFHWRPAIIGIAIGLALGAAAIALPAAGIHVFGLAALEAMGLHGGLLALTTAAIGGLAGAAIGIDREYVRRWLDKAEFTVHEPNRAEREIAAREQDILRLAEAAGRDRASYADKAPVQKIDANALAQVAPTGPVAEQYSLADRRADPVSPYMIAGLKERPLTQVTDVSHQKQLTASIATPAI